MVPVTLITGFLGAGKTTLLNHVLREPHGLRLAVLVNDFGAINIDAELLQDTGEEIAALENGCICCSLSAGLLSAVSRVIRRSDPPDHILIEASGVSDPIEIADALSDPELRSHAPLDGVVAVVDAASAPYLAGDALRLARRQVQGASLVVLGKLDLADDPTLATAWVRGISGRVPMIEVRNDGVPLAALLDNGRGAGQVQSAGSRHSVHAFETFCVTTDKPVPISNLHALLGALPPDMLRVKGIVDLAEKPGNRCILQYTGRHATLTVGRPWGTEAPMSRLVLVGTQGAMPLEEVRRRLEGAPTAAARGWEDRGRDPFSRRGQTRARESSSDLAAPGRIR